MKIRFAALSVIALAAGITPLRLPAQDVIIGEPGWFRPEGAPDQLPQTRRKPEIEYPDDLLTSDETSYVILGRYLDEKGHGVMLEAHSTHPWFTEAAEAAAGDWLMRPARLGGKPVASWSWIPIIFNPASAGPKRPDAKPRLLAVTPVILPEAMLIKLRENTTAWGTVSLDTASVPQKVALEPPASDKLLPFVEVALKQWRFAPARRGGQPVAADLRVAFYFLSAMAPVPAKATMPQVVQQEAPIYPYVLRKYGLTGEVNVSFVVDTNGNVVNPVVLRTTSPEFNQAAVAAVQKWRFKPAMVDNHAVSTSMRVPIVFSFSDGERNDQVAVKSVSRRAQENLPEELRYDVAPRPRGIVLPVYPYALLQAGTQGKATVGFLIGPKGRVVTTKVTEASHPEFGLALAAAVELYRFNPALKNGRPTTTLLKTRQEFSAADLLSDEDRSLLRREKKRPETIVGAARLDKPVRPLLRQEPEFPLALRDKVSQGTAKIELLVDEDGRVRLPRVVDASDPAFGYAAVQAVALWTFRPPTAGGKAAVARVLVPFVFEIKPPVLGTAVGEPAADEAGQ
jgi:TonB family protein